MALDLDIALAPNPGPMTGRGTNTYVIGHGDNVAVIDPGPLDAGHVANIEASVTARGRAALVLLTHHHVDHSEAAIEVARRLGAPLAGIPHPEQPPLDRPLADGDRLQLGLASLVVIHTPGHCRDHACLLWEQERAVFAGDLVATEGFIVISPPDGDMADYLGSLARVRDLDPRVVLPGHGGEIDAPRRHLESYIAHRLERESKVLASLSEREWRSPQQLLPVAYADTPEAMYPVAARSLQAHLEKLVDDGRAEAGDSGYRRKG